MKISFFFPTRHVWTQHRKYFDCLNVLSLNNYLWTLWFSRNHMKKLMTITTSKIKPLHVKLFLMFYIFFLLFIFCISSIYLLNCWSTVLLNLSFAPIFFWLYIICTSALVNSTETFLVILNIWCRFKHLFLIFESFLTCVQ